ncbi:MAG TPA: hypothetical protein VNN21_03495 [Dehalococcoidia bacterium]|nr:hypothetical protein [Dehalococcoidia bacterium]
MKRIFRVDWDVIAGILAAVLALVLHLLHVVEVSVLLAIVLVLQSLLLIRDLRREDQIDRTVSLAERTEMAVKSIQSSLSPPEVLVIGPRRLRAETELFARRARGDMIWFNVCLLMFKPQSLFDTLLRPAIENPLVTSIQFICDESEKARWHDDVVPKLNACANGGKVRSPRWCSLRESVSFILADTEETGKTEALLSFWGEPFMARSVEKDVPRYVFHVQAHSELVTRLSELERSYRFTGVGTGEER